MARRDVQRELENMYAVRTAAPEERTAILRAALRDKVNVIVARAAALSAECLETELMPDLVQAFERMFRDPVKMDAQCWGKTALARALKDLGHAEGATFLRGSAYVQMEPVWGGATDTASTVRGTCALALAQCSDLPREEILRHLVDTCTDAVPAVRSDGVRGLLQMGGDDGALLLRLKARAGDEDAQVVGQALEGVLQLEGDAAVPWAAGFLDAKEEAVSDEAALALGASRLPGAVQFLAARWKNSKAPSATVLRGLSLSRTEEAAGFLLRLLREGRPQDARVARECLQVFAGTPEVSRAVEQIVREREDVFGEVKER